MIIVTGASKGLGLSICNRLQSKGFEVLGLARDTSNLPFASVNCDVADYESVKNVAKSLKLRGKKISGLVNAAGIASMNLAVTTPEHVTSRIINTNLLGTIYCCQCFSPLMIRSRSGSIINFSTIAVALGLKGESIYSASKAGVEGFTRSFSREMSDFNINVNCVAPGPINTELLKGISDTQINNIVKQQVIQRQFTPEAVNDVVELLLDPKSKCLSGQVFHIGGV